jgi:hypothetical protein
MAAYTIGNLCAVFVVIALLVGTLRATRRMS